LAEINLKELIEAAKDPAVQKVLGDAPHLIDKVNSTAETAEKWISTFERFVTIADRSQSIIRGLDIVDKLVTVAGQYQYSGQQAAGATAIPVQGISGGMQGDFMSMLGALSPQEQAEFMAAMAQRVQSKGQSQRPQLRDRLG